jgi:hypothetical protein
MRKLSALALCGLFGVAGCYGEYRTSDHGTYASVSTAVDVAPPAPIVETPPPAPYAGATWTAGYWDWHAPQRRYIWVGGRWSQPPRPGVVYQPPTWHHDGRGYVRQPGRWVPGQTVDRYGRRVWFDAAGRPHYF